MSAQSGEERRCSDCGGALPPPWVIKTHYHLVTKEDGKQWLAYRVGSMTYLKPV